LTADRESLYDLVDSRVDKMIEQGLEAEAKNLFDQKINSRSVLTAIGYKELYKYFNQEITKEEAIELIKKNTRHYVKRQYTWFNNQMDIKWFNVDLENFNKTIQDVTNYIETLGKL